MTELAISPQTIYPSSQSPDMRSEGNVYYPVPEKVPKVRNVDEFTEMKARYVINAMVVFHQLTCLELQSWLVMSDFTSLFTSLLTTALEGTNLYE